MVPRVQDWGWDMGMHRLRRRSRIAGVLAATWLVAGCSFFSPSGTTTEVTVDGPQGDLTIECRGEERPISGDACIDWGDQVIDDLPTESADAVRIVLTDGQGVGRCRSDFQDEAGAVYASAPRRLSLRVGGAARGWRWPGGPRWPG